MKTRKDNTRKAGITITKAAIRRLITEPGEKEVYRQSRNWLTKNWGTPKTKQANGKWRNIKHQDMVISKKLGLGFAIWRIMEIKRGTMIKNTKNPIWDCQLYTIITEPYSLYYVICTRNRYSLSGAN